MISKHKIPNKPISARCEPTLVLDSSFLVMTSSCPRCWTLVSRDTASAMAFIPNSLSISSWLCALCSKSSLLAASDISRHNEFRTECSSNSSCIDLWTTIWVASCNMSNMSTYRSGHKDTELQVQCQIINNARIRMASDMQHGHELEKLCITNTATRATSHNCISTPDRAAVQYRCPCTSSSQAQVPDCLVSSWKVWTWVLPEQHLRLPFSARPQRSCNAEHIGCQASMFSTTFIGAVVVHEAR